MKQSGRYIFKLGFIIIIIISIGFKKKPIDILVFSIRNKIVDTPLENNVNQSNSFYVIGQPEIPKIVSLYFPYYQIVYTNGIGYDRYSIQELGQLKLSSQWLKFPLLNEINTVEPWLPKGYSNKTFPFFQSPPTKSGLAYIDKIYILSDPALSDCIKNVKHMFARHDIPIDSIEWRRIGKWNRNTCNAKENQAEVYQILNLKAEPIGQFVYNTFLNIFFSILSFR